jgi:hypothetical protein
MTNSTTNEKSTEQAAQWANLLTELFDRLTGRGTEISYNFQNLEIDIPRAAGPQGSEIGSAKWVINGRVAITAEAKKIS